MVLDDEIEQVSRLLFPRTVERIAEHGLVGFAVLSSVCIFCTYCLFGQLALLEDIAQVLGDDRALGQAPDGAAGLRMVPRLNRERWLILEFPLEGALGEGVKKCFAILSAQIFFGYLLLYNIINLKILLLFPQRCHGNF